LEIKKLFSEVLQPDIVALGKILNEATKRIKEEHNFSHEVSVMVTNLFDNAQIDALKAFSQEVDNSRIDDHRITCKVKISDSAVP
jgi:uncharacterized protein (DUF1015 family)